MTTEKPRRPNDGGGTEGVQLERDAGFGVGNAGLLLAWLGEDFELL